MTGLLDFEIEIDLSEVETACGEADRELSDTIRRGAKMAADEGLEEARGTRRYLDNTGHLTGDAKAYLLNVTPHVAESEIFWPASYASYVDGGTRPHEIHARRAPELVFFWPKIGGVFRGRRVNHPGTRAYGFAGQAYHKAERVLEREAGVATARIQAIFDR